jgi:hypothetical protein
MSNRDSVIGVQADLTSDKYSLTSEVRLIRRMVLPTLVESYLHIDFS